MAVRHHPNGVKDWSPREREVLDLIARGRTNGEIAEELGISFATAKWHVSELITKLGVDSREDVAEYWRAEQRPLARFGRALSGLAPSFGALKIVGGGVAAVAVVAGGGALFASVTGGDQGKYVEAAEPRETPAAAVETTVPAPTAAVVVDGSASKTVYCQEVEAVGFRGNAFCPNDEYDWLAQFRKGEACDYSGADWSSFAGAGRAGGGTLTGAEGNWNYIDFRGCDLSGVRMGAVAMNEANLSGADLSVVQIQGASISDSLFVGAKLRGAVVQAVLGGADFTDADLTGAVIAGIQVDGARWNNTICPDGTNSDANGGTCLGHGVILIDPSWHDEGNGCSGLCGREQLPELAGAGEMCDLRGRDLSGAILDWADLRGCDLRGANLSGARMLNTSLQGANLESANLDGTTLFQADFTGTNMRDVSLRVAYTNGAIFRQADLTGASLTGSTAVTAANWGGATCPDGRSAEETSSFCFAP